MPVPPQVPLIKFFSPEKSDQGLIEFWSAEVASYQPLDLGTPHPNTREYSGFKLAKQQNLPNDQRFVIRIWVKDDQNALWFAYQVKYLGDANNYPVFVRQFREARKTYTPRTKGQPIKGVYQLRLATAGTGYTPGTEPAITFSGGSGSGAAGHAIVAPDGTIADLILDESGDGYTSAPTITIEAPPSGTTATGTALIQPATALLTAEEAQEFPEDSEFYGLYFRVVRIYETLPGPVVPYTRFDDNLGPVQGTRQAVLWNNQSAELTATGKTTYEARDGSAIVAWKIVELWSDNTGSPGNPVFPSQEWTEFERDGVKKVITKQLKPIGDIITDETLSAGELVRKYSQPFNEFLAFQITETITVIDGDLLDQPSFTTSIPNLIPQIFLAQIPLHVVSHIVEGTATEAALSTGEFEHSERQLTPLYKEVRSTVLDDIGELPITITGMKETNAQKQVVTVEMTLEEDTETPTPPTALVDVDFKKLGNGLAIEITKTIPNVFDADTRSIEIPDVTPAWAKALIPTTTTSIEAAGTSVSDPTLSTGEIRKTVRRTTEKTVETQTTGRDTAELPKSRTNKRLTTEFGGGAVDEVQTVATGSQSISSGGLLVLDSEMEVLGDGTSVLRTSTQTDGSWPVLSDYDIDEETGQTILTTYQVVAAGTATTATVASGVVTRYKHIDKWRSLKIVATYSTPADYDEQRFGAFSFPTLFDYTTYFWSANCGAFADGFRGAFSAMVQMRTHVSFTSTKQTFSGLTLIPKTLLLGKGVQLPQDLIVDAGSFTYSGTCSGTISFGGSDPDYSTYLGSIQGTEQLVTGESVRVKGMGGLFRNTEVYVTML